MGGIHNGYLKSYEGPNNIGSASFSLPSLAAYETYRNEIPNCKKCSEALQFAIDSGCVLSYERSFMQPIFNGVNDKARIE